MRGGIHHHRQTTPGNPVSQGEYLFPPRGTHIRFKSVVTENAKTAAKRGFHRNHRESPGQVDFRYSDLMIDVVRRLAELGVRRPALIMNVVPEAATETNNPQDVTRFYENFTRAAADHGMETRPEWIIHPSPSTPNVSIERFGYESMKTLWSRSRRPDGLFIFPHTAVRGSLTALLELGVNIPGDLKLVAHGNIETPILTPYPVDWITSSSREIVQAMVSQIQKALDGLPAEPIRLKYRPSW